MRKSLLLLICVAATFSSCKLTQKMAVVAPVNDIGVHQYPTVADLDVKPQKVTKTEEWNFVPFNWGQPSLDIRKGNMIAEMVNENDGDVLLEPQTVYRKKIFGKRSLTISGFVASFDNFRKASDDDLKALELGYNTGKQRVYNVASKSPFAQFRKAKSPSVRNTARNAFKASLGIALNGLVGCDESDGRKMGYVVNFEYQRHTPSNLYYAMGLGFAGRGYRTENSEMMSHDFNLMPVGVGYNYRINNSLSVFASLGWYMDFSMVENSDDYFYNDRMYSDGIFDTGFKYGVGVKFGKLSFELMNYSGLMDKYYDNYDHYKRKSLTFSLGVTL